jgi:RecA/RadA recombinase
MPAAHAAIPSVDDLPPSGAPRISKSELESLLRLRRLDHTLTSGREDTRELLGGFPRGELSECIGSRSSGRLVLMVSALAEVTARGEAVALVDPLDMFDPVSAAASGIDFSRMLWVRGEATSSSRVSLSCEYGTLQKSLDRAVKALNLILQAGLEVNGFGLVVIDLAEVSAQALRQLPFTTWLRLHRVIDGSETACVLMGAEHIARSARGITIQLTSGSRLGSHARLPRMGPLQAAGLQGGQARSPEPGVWSRQETSRDVCVPVSAAY